MEMVMCRSCGEFVPAKLEDGVRVPLKDACPDCGGETFKDVEADHVVDTTTGDDD